MIIVFQVMLLIIIFISFIFTFGAEVKKETARHATAICIASIFSFIASAMWL